MKIVCRLLGHLPPSRSPIWSEGRFFGQCPRCQRDIIRPQGSSSWRGVPRGFKVSWRDRTDRDIRWDRRSKPKLRKAAQQGQSGGPEAVAAGQGVRHSPTMTDPLNTAIARLAEFRATWEAGDQIDEYSKLTADDLDLILAQLSWPEDESPNPVMRELR